MMNGVQCIGLSVFLCVGGVSGVSLGEETPTTLEASRGRVVDVAHIYFNMATGERVITLAGAEQTAGADTGTAGSVWSSTVNTPCASVGLDSTHFFELDNNAQSTSLATAAMLLDNADVATNTVVDCVHLEWVTDHDDVDLDSDGVGDGVAGLGGQWTWYDLENGRVNHFCGPIPLISFVFSDLPGDISGTTDPSDPLNTFAKYTMDVDLSASFSSSLTFEICDTDSDSQGAAVYHPGIGNGDGNFDGLPDSDLDGDGLADWGWSVRFFQPGTEDFDDDGVMDGDFADSMKGIGVSIGMPEGEAVDNGDGTWLWDINTAAFDAGTGEEDAYTLYSPPDQFGGVQYAGYFWFGGFSCSDDGSGGHTPAGMFEHQLFGPQCSGCGGDCQVDLNDDGVLNFFDVSLFLSEFAAGDDYNGDGVTNFFDVSSFLGDFNAGCP